MINEEENSDEHEDQAQSASDQVQVMEEIEVHDQERNSVSSNNSIIVALESQ